MEMYPEAKVVLTVRDPQKWFTSAHLLYDQFNSLVAQLPHSLFLRLVGLGRLAAYLRQEGSGTRDGSSPETAVGTLNHRMSQALREGKQQAEEFFLAHIEEVCVGTREHTIPYICLYRCGSWFHPSNSLYLM